MRLPGTMRVPLDAASADAGTRAPAIAAAASVRRGDIGRAYSGEGTRYSARGRVQPRRLRGDDARALSGIDDHAARNVAELREPLEPSYDRFVRTSRDARHRCGVEALWRACAARGDLYLRDYTGLYCSGCAYLGPGDLVDG